MQYRFRYIQKRLAAISVIHNDRPTGAIPRAITPPAGPVVRQPCRIAHQPKPDTRPVRRHPTANRGCRGVWLHSLSTGEALHPLSVFWGGRSKPKRQSVSSGRPGEFCSRSARPRRHIRGIRSSNCQSSLQGSYSRHPVSAHTAPTCIQPLFTIVPSPYAGPPQEQFLPSAFLFLVATFVTHLGRRRHPAAPAQVVDLIHGAMPRLLVSYFATFSKN